MGRNCCKHECYLECLNEHLAILMQVEYLILQSRMGKKKFLVYLLEMVRSEVMDIIQCCNQEQKMQSSSAHAVANSYADKTMHSL